MLENQPENYMPDMIETYDLSFAGALGGEVTDHMRKGFEREKIQASGTPRKNTLELLLENRPKVDVKKFSSDFREQTNLFERDYHMAIVDDVIGLVRHLPVGVETYLDKLQKEHIKGKEEAASYGTATLAGQEFVLFITNFDFFAGTLGVVFGEKFVKAADLARRDKKPLVAVFASGGARQQENTPALVQMPRIENAIDKFKKETHLPYVAICAEAWGGISASAIPQADVIVGIRGTNFGFAGPRVIQTYEGVEVPEGAQSTESHVLERNMHVLLDQEEVIPWLTDFIDIVSSSNRGKLTEAEVKNLKTVAPMRNSQRFQFDIPVFHTLSQKSELVDAEETNIKVTQDIPSYQEDNSVPPDLYNLYLSLMKDPNRPDTEFLLEHCFDGFVPLYTKYTINDEHQGNIIRYPAIIAGLGRIGSQVYLVTGNQPSYQRVSDERVVKIPAGPTPEDFSYYQQMLEMGDHCGFTLLNFTDTPGASPTLRNERAGLSRAISKAIHAGITYKSATIMYISGLFGSGGGLGSSPSADYATMWSNGLACVAEPTSAASILYNKSNPALEEVKTTLQTMKATAEDQKKLKLIDEVLPEPVGGAQADPLEMARRVRESIISVTLRLNRLSEKSRLKLRDRRIRNLRGIPLKNGEV